MNSSQFFWDSRIWHNAPSGSHETKLGLISGEFVESEFNSLPQVFSQKILGDQSNFVGVDSDRYVALIGVLVSFEFHARIP